MFFDKSKLRSVLFHPVRKEDKLFAGIYGCEDVKKLFRMAMESSHTCPILLTVALLTAAMLRSQV